MLRSKTLLLASCAALVMAAAASADWAFWRGPNVDGASADTGLPAVWSPAGENLIWKSPLGGRSTPIVVKGMVCVIRLSDPETPAKWREQIVCVDEKTGAVRWEHRDNIFQTDIPHHRVGWASLVADPASGDIFAHSISGVVTAFTADGKIRWRRSLDEEIGRFSGFGGRTVTPILDDDLLVVSFLTAGFGPNFIPRHRFYALDKTTGDTVWLSTPGQAPYDTTYSAPIVRTIGGERLLIAGNGDGSISAMQARTGKPVWSFPLSKRGINSAVVADGSTIFASHSEENVDGSTAMGRLVALDASKIVDGKPVEIWRADGFMAGYASPALHNGVLYHVDNAANLVAFDAKNGEQLWREKLGIAQRASPVVADGKLYVSDVDGQFHIYKLNGRSAPEKLHLEEFKNPDGSMVQINGSPAIANGRVYFSTNNELYALGTSAGKAGSPKLVESAPERAPAGAKAAWLQVVPAEIALKPGASRKFIARAFDEKGRLIGPVEAQWSAQGLKGTISPAGELKLGPDNVGQGGVVKAVAAGVEAVAQVRVMPEAPYSDNFNSYDLKAVPAGWPAIRGRYETVEREGEKVLFKDSKNLRSQKTTVYFGPPDARGYEIAIDALAVEKARKLPDVGLISHRYTLDLQGNKQKLMIRTWTSEPGRFAKEVRFKFDPDVWYRMRFRVEPSEEGGPTKLFGKVWKRGEAEPDAWTLEAVDPIGNSHGSAGIYGYALGDIYFDNLDVTRAN